MERTQRPGDEDVEKMQASAPTFRNRNRKDPPLPSKAVGEQLPTFRWTPELLCTQQCPRPKTVRGRRKRRIERQAFIPCPAALHSGRSSSHSCHERVYVVRASFSNSAPGSWEQCPVRAKDIGVRWCNFWLTLSPSLPLIYRGAVLDLRLHRSGVRFVHS